MTKFLLTVHVLAAIVAIGPVTVAASMFPPTVRRAMADPTDPQAVAWVRLLHRICRVYAVMGAAVPVFGFATASSMGVLGDTWLIVSIVLTAIAAGVLGALVLPRQEALLTGIEAAASVPSGAEAPQRVPAQPESAQPDSRRATARLAMATGIFNLLWATVTVLMIVRPGSTTGA
ncbi:protease [Streptomyces sp. GMY02]|uniref:protease n=1 Tax=Streptomyces sp. GMY02 TaxID=1333528 RepID=UPI001C2BBFA7|nr:protease [Streptomyces sp. GMY02]QXE33378.1 protease [Streptomyces sp. GMY02]